MAIRARIKTLIAVVFMALVVIYGMATWHVVLHTFAPHGYDVEWIQAIVSVIALAFSAWSLVDARRDEDALKKSGANGFRGSIAKRNVRGEAAKLIILAIFSIMGACAVALPPPDDVMQADKRHELNEQHSITINRVGVMIVTMIMLIDSVDERRQRLQFVRNLRKVGKNGSRLDYAPPPGRSDNPHDYPAA